MADGDPAEAIALLEKQIDRDRQVKKAAKREIAFLREQCRQLEERLAAVTGVPVPGLVLEAAPPPDHAAASADMVSKKARGRLLWSGLTDREAFILECNCLIRLNRLPGAAIPGRRRFPALLSHSLEDVTLVLSNQGKSLKSLSHRKARIEVCAVEEQIDGIVGDLDAAGVIHLDVDPIGRNVTVSEHGRLSLIDFDIASLDGIAHSGRIRELLEAFHDGGGFAGLRTRLHEVVRSCGGLKVIA